MDQFEKEYKKIQLKQNSNIDTTEDVFNLFTKTVCETASEDSAPDFCKEIVLDLCKTGLLLCDMMTADGYYLSLSEINHLIIQQLFYINPKKKEFKPVLADEDDIQSLITHLKQAYNEMIEICSKDLAEEDLENLWGYNDILFFYSEDIVDYFLL